MGKDVTTDCEQVGEDGRGYRVMAAEKKVAKKKAGKKAAKKTAKKAPASKKAATARKKSTATRTVAVAAPRSEPASAPQPGPAVPPPTLEARSGGAMRGIIALWGPLAIIVMLIVVSRLGDDDSDGLGRGAVDGLSASLESAERIARDVVEDVQDALTGGDPQAAAALDTRVGAPGSSGSTKGDLAAAFHDAGGTSAPPPPPSSKRAATAAGAWGQSDQTTTPASVSGVPGALPPHPENPWAPVGPRSATAMSADPYSQDYSQAYPPAYSPAYPPAYPQAGGPPPVAPFSYGAPPQPQGYPPLPSDYGSSPAYGGSPPGYSQQQAYGAPPAYGYPPQPYGAPAPYPYPPPGYYPPAQ